MRHPTVVTCVVVICSAMLGLGRETQPASLGDDDRTSHGLATAEPPGPFPMDLAFSLRRPFSDYERAAVSPSGGHVAYAVVAPGKRRADLWTLPSGLPVV